MVGLYGQLFDAVTRRAWDNTCTCSPPVQLYYLPRPARTVERYMKEIYIIYNI